jgi:hypothetical protein
MEVRHDRSRLAKAKPQRRRKVEAAFTLGFVALFNSWLKAGRYGSRLAGRFCSPRDGSA